jgi:predicted aspartyl protease
VDTGANHSTLTPALAQQLGLTPESGTPMILDGITGSAQVSFVTVARLQAGDLTLQDTAMPVISTSIMAGTDGILGAAGLSEKSLLIDFRRNRVAIAGRLDYSAQAATTRIHASSVSNGLIVLESVVAGVHVQAVLDTGSERTLGNLALRDALQPRYHSGRSFAAVLTSVYGATTQAEPGEIRSAPTIAVGSLRIADVAIVYGDFHIFKVWQMQDRPAMILGMDVLGTVASLGIDFRHRNVYVGGKPADLRDLLESGGFSTGTMQNR